MAKIGKNPVHKQRVNTAQNTKRKNVKNPFLAGPYGHAENRIAALVTMSKKNPPHQDTVSLTSQQYPKDESVYFGLSGFIGKLFIREA